MQNDLCEIGITIRMEGMPIAATQTAEPRGADPAFDLDGLIGNAQRASDMMKALSHEARLVILCLLAEGERSVGEIERVLQLRQPAVSQQLARLRAEGMVKTRREGKNIYYSLARTEVREVIGALHRAFCTQSR
jgi:DNA-binding transcriptional ArsR family regulator